jgi:hypothetical protein
MDAVNVILDWLLAHAGRPLERPAPATEAELRELTELEAPHSLLQLYRSVGSDLRGLVPDETFGDILQLRTPTRVHREVFWNRQEEPMWLFTEPAECPIEGWRGREDQGWVITRDGTVSFLRGMGRHYPDLSPEIGGLSTLFERHLQSLTSGALVWHPGWERFMARRQLPDPAPVASCLDPHTEEITRLLVQRLQDRELAPLMGLGTLSVYDRGRMGSFLEYDDGRDDELAWYLEDGPCPFPPLPVEGLSEEDQRALAQKLAETVRERLRQKQPVEWPGVGMFKSVSEFLPYPALERALGFR